MSTTYKTFLDNDIASSRTLLHENIPISGTILSDALYSKDNIKSFTHGMFQSVYDYPHTSSAANHLFDMTAGITSISPASSSTDAYAKKKINVYNQLAQVTIGYDSTGSIMKFDRDGDQATGIVDDKFNSVFVLNFSRLLVKDEIKKGTFKLSLGIGEDSSNPFAVTCLISDASGTLNYKVNSPTGEYGILYATDFSNTVNDTAATNQVGLIFYQAGIAVISTGVFATYGDTPVTENLLGTPQGQLNTYNAEMADDYPDVFELFKNGTIEDINDCFRKRIQNIRFNNTTELNSTIHFCRVNHNEFNYSSNPTYLSSSQIIVKSKPTDAPISYITTVGLYSADNELLAVAKLSEPIKKDPTQELILRVRLDY